MSAGADFEAGKQAYLDGRLDAAETELRAHLAARPGHFDSMVYLARTLDGLARFDDAIALYRQALAATPDHAATHLLLAQALLATGRYAEGWREYEWRNRGEGGAPFPNIEAPRWHGEALDGRTVLIVGEQGFGDVIQFARFLSRVKARGGRVSMAVSRPLAALFNDHPAIDHLFTDWHRVGAFDCYCPLSSLPEALEIDADDLPGEVPYIAADERRAKRWARRLGPAERRRIGLCWAGRPTHPNDRNRSLPFETLRARLPADADLVSLQTGGRGDDLSEVAILDVTERLHDFAETAALIANLDLVVSVDTSVVHLAGAMGKPVHVLLPFVADCRWGRKGDSTPWYPSARLFRQDAPGDWASALVGAFEPGCYKSYPAMAARV